MRAFLQGLLPTQSYLPSLDENDVQPLTLVPEHSTTSLVAQASVYSAGDFIVPTNTSAQIRLRNYGATGSRNIYTYGWIDRRGRDA